ncbi:MAG: DUF2452 domain-containing protein [Flavobacteriaceae bacterium]|jgi:hypothetical protein|nr:DUF2452 domain-containing protein [Flavobacteriaceae bacterium]MDG1063356.1 DUF2452 domain-containing protein [Flavobacteriaceae bacterium]MDG1962309.1 DUF2452 domain-containing protein [Flavobacteriaceae bacterium]
MESKKPDNVAFDQESQKYVSSLLPYATNVGAPVITAVDTVAWKNRSVNKVNHRVKTKLMALREEYNAAMEEFELNKLILSAKFNFEPIVGSAYHLYRRADQSTFLSLIEPETCHFHWLGSYAMNADMIWQKLK